MDLLIVEPLEAEVLRWLDARHELFYSPWLPGDRRALQEALAQTRAVMLPPSVAVTSTTLLRAPRLRAIGRVVEGPENIDKDACARAGIEIVRSIDATAPAEAEFMLGALLALLRPSPEADSRQAGRELGSCTVGLVGMTHTARALARMLGAFGTRLVGYDPALHSSHAHWRRWGVQPLGLLQLFERCDAVCVQLNYFSRYHGLLGERYLPFCRPGQVLVSVSQAGLFDDKVLAEVLKSGRMSAAWLDSVSPGMLEPGQPLHQVQSLLVTPRLAAYTREARLRSAWAVARRIDEILRLTPAGLRNARPGVGSALAAVDIDVAAQVFTVAPDADRAANGAASGATGAATGAPTAGVANGMPTGPANGDAAGPLRPAAGIRDDATGLAASRASL